MTLLNHIVGDDLAINYGLKMLYPKWMQHFDFLICYWPKCGILQGIS